MKKYMKKYMKKTLIDRPRSSSYTLPYKYYRKKIEREATRVSTHYEEDEDWHGFDNSPKSLPMRKIYGWDRKEFSDHLRPLQRWLDKQEGRPWAEVWSEICAENDSRNVTGWHLREHVRSEVVDNVVGDFGGGFLRVHRNDSEFLAELKRSFWADYLCVDEDGILRKFGNLDRKIQPMRRLF